MNEHLPLHFGRGRGRVNTGGAAFSPTPHVEARLDDSVTQYLYRTTPAEETATWCRVAEIPTTEEILTSISSSFDEQARDGKGLHRESFLMFANFDR